MLATTGTPQDISSDHLLAVRREMGRDSCGCHASVRAGLTLHSRAGNDFTRSYPEVAELADLLDGHSAVLDGEIVVLDDHGVTSFSRLQQRMNLAGARDIARMRHEMPVQFWLFDVLWLDGVSLLRKKYDDRRRILQALPLSGDVCRVPEQLAGSVDDALAGQRRPQVGGDRGQAGRFPVRARTAIADLVQDEELPDAGSGRGRLATRRRPASGKSGVAAGGGPRRRRTSLRRQGRHRLHRRGARPADGCAAPTAAKDLGRGRQRAAGGQRRTRSGSNRPWSVRSDSRTGPANAGCARRVGAGFARTSP